MKIIEYKGPIFVTTIYILIYYGFIFNILRTKLILFKKYKKEGKKFDRYFGQDRNMLAADRAQINMLEQMPVFLILLWLCAIFHSAKTATILGSVYVLSRALYPFLVGARMGRDIPLKLLVSTFTGYGVIITFMMLLLYSTLGM